MVACPNKQSLHEIDLYSEIILEGLIAGFNEKVAKTGDRKFDVYCI